MRYLITFSYDGTKFHGFQRQNDVVNVQGMLEHTLSNYFDTTILIKGSGRTDAGVHASGQYAHFDVDKLVKKEDVKKINALLQGNIKILKLKKVNDDFHARHNVSKKIYVYKINNGEYKSSMDGYYYQIRYKLDVKKMKEVVRILTGTHDYHNFVSGSRPDYISTIFKIKIKKQRDIIILKFVGVGFYRYMVRHLVGAILDVGKGKASIEDVLEMLNQPDVYKNLSVVPACGLYLEKVFY